MPRRRHVSPDQGELFPALPPPPTCESFPGASTQRLFLGLLPDEATQGAIGRQRQTWTMPSAALFTKADRLHLTLHFLGEVERSRALALQDALAEVRMEATHLSLRTPALWSVAVVRPDENERLRDLHDRLLQPLRRVGLQAGTKWTPHVTIARNAKHAVPPAEMPSVDWPVHDFALVWSRFVPTARYEVLRRYGAASGSTGSASGTNLVPCP